ncbi:hypothetical protein BDB01DRAFT_606537 [Pilobolus umbonatus]|nr:hypothetical protein BDB01DRAFT_606537 [Pilobolus umbonatus]
MVKCTQVSAYGVTLLKSTQVSGYCVTLLRFNQMTDYTVPLLRYTQSIYDFYFALPVSMNSLQVVSMFSIFTGNLIHFCYLYMLLLNSFWNLWSFPTAQDLVYGVPLLICVQVSAYVFSLPSCTQVYAYGVTLL